MTEQELRSKDKKFRYMFLGRLQMDCEYFLGCGNGCSKHLWTGDVLEQIDLMFKCYKTLPKKPKWIKKKDIRRYKVQMLALQSKAS